MAPKNSSSKPSKADKSDKEAADAINQYLAQKPNFDKLIKDAKESSGRSFPETRRTDYHQKVKEAVKEVFEERQKRGKVKDKPSENA